MKTKTTTLLILVASLVAAFVAFGGVASADTVNACPTGFGQGYNPDVEASLKVATNGDGYWCGKGLGPAGRGVYIDNNIPTDTGQGVEVDNATGAVTDSSVLVDTSTGSIVG